MVHFLLPVSISMNKLVKMVFFVAVLVLLFYSMLSDEGSRSCMFWVFREKSKNSLPRNFLICNTKFKKNIYHHVKTTTLFLN